MPLNEGHAYRERLDAAAAGRTLLDYLSARYAHSSREEWRARIADGRVLLDALPAEPETPLRAGQEVTWLRPAWAEPDVPGEAAVL